MESTKENKAQPGEIRNIQLKVPADLYKRFKLVCTRKDSNMREMLLKIMGAYTEYEEDMEDKVSGKKKVDIWEWMQNADLAERIFAKAAKKAIAESHAMGLPTAHGDNIGLYYLYPDGHKEYISEAEAAEIPKGRTRYNTDPEALKALGQCDANEEESENMSKGPLNGR